MIFQFQSVYTVVIDFSLKQHNKFYKRFSCACYLHDQFAPNIKLNCELLTTTQFILRFSSFLGEHLINEQIAPLTYPEEQERQMSSSPVCAGNILREVSKDHEEL